jgi:glycosyltransferase involved in cell wall biosynthesis
VAQPLVSILINNYNYGAFLPVAIESALNQTYNQVEVIVVDDGSTDDSGQILQQYGDTIRVILKPNGGQASSFNVGFAACQGEIICFLDADDWFVPEKAAQVAAIFQQHPDLGWCFHPMAMFHSSSQQLIRPLPFQSQGCYDITAAVQQGKLAGKLPIADCATSGMCFARSHLEKILPMPEEIRITSDDYLKYVAWGTAMGYVSSAALSVQRLHANNAYTNRADNQQLRAYIHCLTAYWLRQNFPIVTPFANNLMAAGLRLYQGLVVNAEEQRLIRQYLGQSSWAERSQIYLRSVYYRVKDGVTRK